ncbi:glycosyltransferase family 9 protein [Fulvivirga sp.]|uniref:glycosyltransferase family 9 protein n=1 Tax=Fulvivirga sp. TaxID=1931237 RepID=UPI0032EEFE7F
MQKILIIQTAFLGDVVLATALIEKLSDYHPEAELHFLLRKGNEGILKGHPKVKKLWILDKSRKFASMTEIVKGLRKEHFDLTINLQRFLSSGVIASLSGAKKVVGFKKNPMSMFFSEKYDHQIEPDGTVHEVERNQQLIADITDDKASRPKVYPSMKDFDKVEVYKSEDFITIAPASVWFTKQWPKEKWIDFINELPAGLKVYLIGAPGDLALCDEIMQQSKHQNIQNLTGKLSPLASAALIRDAVMNYVNDSAPLHFASAMNAPVRAVFCSTVNGFGFGPLSDNGKVINVKEPLSCRPCGLHGHRACPEGHFKCALLITSDQLLEALPK